MLKRLQAHVVERERLERARQANGGGRGPPQGLRIVTAGVRHNHGNTVYGGRRERMLNWKKQQ
jgi:hypothetical protein